MNLMTVIRMQDFEPAAIRIELRSRTPIDGPCLSKPGEDIARNVPLKDGKIGRLLRQFHALVARTQSGLLSFQLLSGSLLQTQIPAEEKI